MQGQVQVKERFAARYSELTDYDVFMQYSLRYLRRSIRVNTLKIGLEQLRQRLGAGFRLEQIPWCREGFFIEHLGQGDEYRRDIGNLPEHSLGYFFIQEAASMIPPVVLDPQPGENILDMCASPGAKTTQIAQYMKNTGALVANDYRLDRIKALGLNVQRMGVSNCIITMQEGRHFRGVSFDRILLDAPCSGTGAIRKSFKTLRIWNPNMVRRLAAVQKQLIETAFRLLRPGGVLVYSTCTLEPEENEGVLSSLLEKHRSATAVPVRVAGLKRSPPVAEFLGRTHHPSVRHALRIWPQDNDTEGFFVAKVQKG